MSARGKLRRGAVWLVLGYGVRSAAYLGVTAVLARGLSAGEFGQFSLFVALVSGLAYLAGSWPFLSLPVLAAAGARLRALIAPALALACLSAACLAVGFVPLTLAVTDAGALAPLVLYVLALIALQAAYAVFQTSERMRGIALGQAAERLTVLAVLVALAAATGLTLAGARVAVAASVAAVALLVGALALRGIPAEAHPPESEPLARRLRTILAAVGPMSVVAACSYAVAYVDLFLLAAFVDDAEVGRYALAYMVFTFLLQLGSLWIVVALPHHAGEAAGQRPVREMLSLPELRDAGRLWSAAVAALALACAALLTPVFGSEYEPSLGPLLVLIGSAPLLAAYFAAVPILIALGKTRTLALISVAGVAVNVGLDLALIPLVGIWGPAVATAVQNLVTTAAVLAQLVEWREIAAVFAQLAPFAVAVTVLAVEPAAAALLVPLALLCLLAAASGLAALRAREPARAR